MKKFELTAEKKINRLGRELYRIRALISFETMTGEEINAGDLGGYVESEKNLSQDDTAWIYDDAEVYGNAKVYGDAKVWSNAEIWGGAKVYGSAEIWGKAEVCGNAEIWDGAEVCGHARVWGIAEIWGNATVCGDAAVGGIAKVYGDALVCGNAEVYGDALVCGNALVSGNAAVSSNEHILNITPIGTTAESLTFFRTKTRGIGVSFGHDVYTLDAFKRLITDWTDKRKTIAQMAIKIAETHIDLASSGRTHCPRCEMKTGKCRQCI